jgi:hypothetical protein
METMEEVQISADEILAMLHSEPVDLPKAEIPWPQQGEWTYIVDPETRSIEVYVWRNGLYELHTHAVGDVAVTSTLFPELALRVNELFPSVQTGG